MYYFFIGTIAELIKMFPVIQEFEKRDISYKILATGQNDITGSDLYPFLNHAKILSLSTSPIKASALGLFSWFIKNIIANIYKLFFLIKKDTNTAVYFIVHGDTVSTVMGAVVGFFLGATIVHVEAGLRSFNIFHPFPEELDRLIVSRLSKFHFCAGSWALNNLKNISGVKVDTLYNTLVESMYFALSTNIKSDLLTKLNNKKFFIFVLHRQENLFNQRLVDSLVSKISLISESTPCLFVLHKTTKIAMENLGILEPLYKKNSIIFVDRIPYMEFTHLLSKCEFIITDGGSNQEESYYLGKPCLVLRMHTERVEGLNENVVLSKLDETVIDNFVKSYKDFSREKVSFKKSPSAIIVDSLMDNSL